MTVRLSPLAGAGWQLFDDSGIPLAGGKIYTYTAGSSTPQATYTTSAGNIAHSNPIVLDANGRVPNEIWLTQGIDYKFIIKTSAEVLVGTYDNLQGINDVENQFAAIFADLANTSNVAKGDALIGFKQANMAGVYTGAIGQTVHRKLQEIISVFDFMTTAQIEDVQAGTSLIDVRTPINNAFAAVIGNGGGTLYFPKGTYYVSDSIGNTDYAGNTQVIRIAVIGEPGTVINCNPTVYANIAVFLRFLNAKTIIVKNLEVKCNTKVAGGIFATSNTFMELCLVDGCIVDDCNAVNNAGVTTNVLPIVLSSNGWGYGASVTNCIVRNVTRAKTGVSCQAIVVVGFGSAIVANNNVQNVRHSGVVGDKIDADGIVVFSSQDGSGLYQKSALVITGNLIRNCEGRFIKLQTHGSALVEGNFMSLDGSLELIENFRGVDSQVGQATIINNKIEIGTGWTGGNSGTIFQPQLPTAANLRQTNELFVQKVNDNEVYIQKQFTYGILISPFTANVAAKCVVEVCNNKMFSNKTLDPAPGDTAVINFINYNSIPPVVDVTGQTIWIIANNQVMAFNFIGVGSTLTSVDYTDKWWMYIYNNVKYGGNVFLIINIGGSSYAFPYTSNVMVRDNQMGTAPGQNSDGYFAPLNSTKLINGSDFSTGDSSAGTISPAPANWRGGHFGRKGGVLFAETVSAGTAYRYVSTDNGANWYQV
jgi:hypothetical protein